MPAPEEVDLVESVRSLAGERPDLDPSILGGDLVAVFKRLIGDHARGWASDRDDLVQEGLIAALEGVRRFDAAKAGKRPATFIGFRVRGYLKSEAKKGHVRRRNGRRWEDRERERQDPGKPVGQAPPPVDARRELARLLASMPAADRADLVRWASGEPVNPSRVARLLRGLRARFRKAGFQVPE